MDIKTGTSKCILHNSHRNHAIHMLPIRILPCQSILRASIPTFMKRAGPRKRQEPFLVVCIILKSKPLARSSSSSSTLSGSKQPRQFEIWSPLFQSFVATRQASTSRPFEEYLVVSLISYPASTEYLIHCTLAKKITKGASYTYIFRYRTKCSINFFFSFSDAFS